ncbi:MAG: DUF6261 family protein [Tannerellaceae bacterium]|jgi:hypothetical protein|nr:DUF6261 family protein [Tannerellaceae bacterium]
MKRIEGFYLPGMSQRQVFLFFQTVHRLMEMIHDSKLQPKLRYFSNAIMTFDAALKSIPDNHLAEKISAENNNRDKAFEVICEEADILLIENNVFGQKLKNILSSYEDLPLKTNEEKIGMFNNFIAELENLIGEEDSIDDIKLLDHVSLLKRSNWAYKQYLEAYKIELTGKCLTYETLRTRKEAEETYKDVVEFINAMLIYNGDAEYGEIIDQINHLIHKNRKVEQEIKQAIYVQSHS